MRHAAVVAGATAAALGVLQTLAFVHLAAWPLPLLTLAVGVAALDRITPVSAALERAAPMRALSDAAAAERQSSGRAAWVHAVFDSAAPVRAAWLGWCYGVGWLGAGVWWLFVSMHRYGGLPAPLAALAVLALAGALSLYLALAAAAYVRWRCGRARDIALLAALWLLAELARGVLFTGFPWLALGYSQIEGPLAVLAPWVGVYGIGAVGAALAAALAQGFAPAPGVVTAPAPTLSRRGSAASTLAPVQPTASMPPAAGVISESTAARSSTASRPASPRHEGVRRRLRWAPPAAAALVLAAAALADVPPFTRSTGELTVTLLQPAVDQAEKFSPAHFPQAMAWVREALLDARGQLVVAPETAVPLLPAQLAVLAPGYWESLRAHFAAGDTAALVGVPLGDFGSGYTNSVVALGPGLGYRYDKWHLVPFGEFIPWGFRWFTRAMSIPLGDFERGVPAAPSLAWRGQRLAPNICYEDLFGEELARRFADPAAAPTVLVNIGNIAWFGRTWAVPQHLAISRLRALEFQLPMVRATNTGATAVIDHHGRVTASLPPHERAVLDARVEGRAGVTPFARWAAAAGLWPLWVVALATVAACAAAPWLRRRAAATAVGTPGR